LPEETIIAECEEGKYSFYATDKRIIKYKKGGRIFDTEVMHDLSYKEITGLSLTEKRGHSICAAVGASFLMATITLIYQYNYAIDVREIDSIIVVLGVVGLLLLLYGILYKRKWFEFKGPGILQDKDESKLWRLKEVKNPDVREFVRTVRTQLDLRG